MEHSKTNSRTKNTIYNFISGIGGQFLTIFMQFIVRTVFIQTLGKSYLGINGLFSNILSMLSLAELGFGNAILFKLYSPLAKKDTKRINILMNFYKNIYRVVGIVIIIIGIAIIPFLPMLINDYDKLDLLGINSIFIYLLYLLQSVSSYLFFAYKSAIVRADQKEYRLNIVSYVFTIFTSVIQIILLKFVTSFELYVGVAVICVILNNIVNAHIAKKYYPFINDKVEEKLDKKEIKEIFKDCSALFLYKINGVVLKATDNIVISTVMGLDMVGIYSNYYVLYTTIRTIFVKIFNSVVHSIGNLHTGNNLEHEYKILKVINLITVILGATAGIGIFCVADEFIDAWIGDIWVIAQPFSLFLGIEIFNLALSEYLTKYRTSMGLFQNAKYRPIFSIIINLVVSCVLVNCWGICGVIVGTVIADFTTILWYEPLIIHRHGLKNKFSLKKYYSKNIIYITIFIALGIFNYFICENLAVGFGWLSVIIHAIICGITVPLTFIVLFSKTEEGEYLINLVKKQFKSIYLKLKGI